MDLGALEVQIFVSLSLVLGTIFVALVCDFLKGNNELLRERNIELRVRQEERERLRQTAPFPADLRGDVATEDTPVSGAANPSKPDAWARPEELDEADQIANGIRSRVQENPSKTTAPSQEPEEALSGPSLALHAKVTPIDRLALERFSSQEALHLAEELAQAANVAAEEIARSAPEEDSLELSLPSGMLERATFEAVISTEDMFRGAVVAVGINGNEGASQQDRQIEKLMQSLLDHDALGCRTDDNECVLIFPGEDGATGQRRFQYVSQLLWDYQIRSVGSSSITFSWGATETENASLAATVASARERLEQTRRHRERAPSQIHSYRLIND